MPLGKVAIIFIRNHFTFYDFKIKLLTKTVAILFSVN